MTLPQGGLQEAEFVAAFAQANLGSGRVDGDGGKTLGERLRQIVDAAEIRQEGFELPRGDEAFAGDSQHVIEPVGIHPQSLDAAFRGGGGSFGGRWWRFRGGSDGNRGGNRLTSGNGDAVP